MPVYNAAKTLSQAAESIINQSFKDWEVIIIDDGSTDDSVAVTNSFKQANVRYYHLEHGGIGRALNFGIKMSRGKYIARMDADDILLPERLQLQVDYLENNVDVGLVSSLITHQGDEHQDGYKRYVERINNLISPDDIYQRRFSISPFAHPSVMFRKALFFQYGFYNEGQLPEDYELWMRWFGHGVKLHKLNYNLLICIDLIDRASKNFEAYSHDAFYKVKAIYLAKALRRDKRNHLPIYIWGTGRLINRYASYLKDQGLNVFKFIDVKQVNDSPHIIHYTELNDTFDGIIAVYVRDTKGQQKIISFLKSKDLLESVDYYIMS